MYQIFIRLISTSLFIITISFRKTKLLMFYSCIMPDIDTFANMRKTTLAAPSVCSSVRIEQLGSHWADFYDN